ncbi:MAG: hypothetical protein AAGE86_01310 [Pseudomonadota bacterium]
MSFGKKGLNASQARQGARSAAGFGAASAQAAEQADPYAAQREAFLAEERARRESNAPAAPIDFSPPAHRSQPAPFVSNYAGERSDLRSKVEDWTDDRFGLPHQRRTMMAYFLLFMLAPVSMHRFYCGEFTKGMAQIGLFGGGLLFLAIFPPIGLVMLAFRGFWVFFDFLMIPGMMQRLKDRSGSGRSVMV